MSISTKGVKKAGVSKEIKPGNVVAKINSLAIEKVKTPKDPSNPEYRIYFELETKPVGGDFVGFDKVFGDPSKGQYAGQTKKIKSSDWPIKSYSYIAKQGKFQGQQVTKSADSQILDLLQKLLTAAGADTWLEDNDGKYDTWEQLFTGIVRSGILKEKYFSWCLAATQSTNTKGYPMFHMYLPDYRVCPNPFAIEGGLVTKFDPAVHIKLDNKAKENAALNDGEDEVADDDDNEFANAPETSPFDDADDSELFDLDDND